MDFRNGWCICEKWSFGYWRTARTFFQDYIIDGEAINIGLKSKYEAECVRKFLWKRMMFIEPVSFALRFVLEYFTYVDVPCMAKLLSMGWYSTVCMVDGSIGVVHIPCMAQFAVMSVFTWYVWCMDNMSLHMCTYGVWCNLLSMGQYLHSMYGAWTIWVYICVRTVFLDKCINNNMFWILLDERRCVVAACLMLCWSKYILSHKRMKHVHWWQIKKASDCFLLSEEKHVEWLDKWEDKKYIWMVW